MSKNVDSMIGKSIVGYNFTKRIGSGAFGRVYEATKGGDQGSVAIKMLHNAEAGFFESEIMRVLSDHKHFLRWHEYFTHDEYQFIVTAVAYKDLGRLMNMNSPREFTQVTVQCLGRQLICGLEYLHSKHITHGDIKPTNLLMALPKGRENVTRMLISDFGIATKYDKDVGMCGTNFDYHEYSISSPYIEKNGTPKPRDDLIQMAICLLELSGHNLNDLSGDINSGNEWKKTILTSPLGNLDPDFLYMFEYLKCVGRQTLEVNYSDVTAAISAMIPGSAGNQNLHFVYKGDDIYRLY